MSKDLRKLVQVNLIRSLSRGGGMGAAVGSLMSQHMSDHRDSGPERAVSTTFKRRSANKEKPKAREGEVIYCIVRIYPFLGREEIRISRVKSLDNGLRKLERVASDDRRSFTTPIQEEGSPASSTNNKQEHTPTK